MTEPIVVARVVEDMKVKFSEIPVGNLFYYNRDFWVKIDSEIGKQINPNIKDLGNQKLSKMVVQPVKFDHSLELSW